MIGFQRVGLKRGVSSCGQWLEICSFTTRKIVRDLGHSIPCLTSLCPRRICPLLPDSTKASYFQSLEQQQWSALCAAVSGDWNGLTLPCTVPPAHPVTAMKA